ncbi:MAG TPA: BatA domain-containing protein, partial [Gemmatimonadaceae bacterium]|nr:BatA domain-containing protein [Gemmatimonadaceae bacterium]
MTFLAPGFFFASLAVAAGVIALHFIVTRQPRAAILPTARFVPDLPATATARATRPSDLLLMLLRVLLVLAAGAGLAKPIFKPSRGAEARVILADVSRSSSDLSAVRDSVRALYRDHDALVVFDSSARVIATNVRDSIATLEASQKKGNLSAALIAAMRAGSALRDRADSIELIIVSPFALEEMDAATDSIRQLWPGRARLVRIGRTDSDVARIAQKLEIKTNAADPLQVTASLARNDSTATGLIVRDPSEEVSNTNDRAVIEWPESARPR